MKDKCYLLVKVNGIDNKVIVEAVADDKGPLELEAEMLNSMRTDQEIADIVVYIVQPSPVRKLK